MKKMIIGAVLVCLAASQPAQAVYIEFSGTPGVTPLSMTFAEDVNFTITKSSTTSMLIFAIEGLFVAPDADTDMFKSFEISPTLEFSVNAGSHFQIQLWGDNIAGNAAGDLTSTDSYFAGGSDLTFSEGDIVTLYAGTMTGTALYDGFNLGITGNYSMFLADENLTNITAAVPEPASAMMLLFGAGISMAIYRARRWANR